MKNLYIVLQRMNLLREQNLNILTKRKQIYEMIDILINFIGEILSYCVYICMYACIHKYIYTHVNIYIHIYTHVYVLSVLYIYHIQYVHVCFTYIKLSLIITFQILQIHIILSRSYNHIYQLYLNKTNENLVRFLSSIKDFLSSRN